MGTFLMCPVCGRNCSLSHFDPSGFDVDIMTQEIRGLGKGKGFATSGRSSILGRNGVTMTIYHRMIVLIVLLMDENIVSRDEVRKDLGFPEVETIVERDEDELQAMREEAETRETGIGRVIGEMAEALGENAEDYVNEGDDDDDELVARLGYFARRLIDDYTAARDNADEN